MTYNEYIYYKEKYKLLMEAFQGNQENADIYQHLRTMVKFDDQKHKIFYNGDNEELIKCYFPLAILTMPYSKREKKFN